MRKIWKRLNHLNWDAMYNHSHALLSLMHFLFFSWTFLFKVLILWLFSPSLSTLFPFSPSHFFLPMFSSPPQWAAFEFSFLRPSLLPFCPAFFFEFFLCPFFSDFPVPFIKTLREFPQESFPILFLPVAVTWKKLGRPSYPKSMILSKLFSYNPNWSQWHAYLCTI